MIEPVALSLAYILDLAIGDPRQLPHPVRIMGWGIMKLEGFLRRFNIVQNGSKWFKNSHSLKLAGVILVLIIVGSTYGLFSIINSLLTSYSSLFTSIILIYLISTTLATRELIKSAQKVSTDLKVDRLEEAKKNLSYIVGRDTKKLDKKGISKATIETLAENTSDGIVAPLFYFVIGGLPLAMTYKAINTLDSMVGYKNEKYKDFGWAAAKLDDIANYIPARITGFLIVVSAFVLDGLRWLVQKSSNLHSSKLLNVVQSSSNLNNLEPLNHFEQSFVNSINAFKIMKRDGRNHSSPNSGIPEAAMAGALGIRLGGPAYYGGRLVEKPYIGEDLYSSGGFKIVQNSSKVQDSSKTNNVEQFYLQASEKAVLLVKVTSILGFGMAVSFIYLKTFVDSILNF